MEMHAILSLTTVTAHGNSFLAGSTPVAGPGEDKEMRSDVQGGARRRGSATTTSGLYPVRAPVGARCRNVLFRPGAFPNFLLTCLKELYLRRLTVRPKPGAHSSPMSDPVAVVGTDVDYVRCFAYKEC